jgi:hypothetical protein
LFSGRNAAGFGQFCGLGESVDPAEFTNDLVCDHEDAVGFEPGEDQTTEACNE